jgi:hypothetical protein
MDPDNVVPLERIRRYRVEVNRRKVASQMYRVSKFLLEASTVCAVLGRGIQFMSRELGYDHNPRRIRIPFD